MIKAKKPISITMLTALSAVLAIGFCSCGGLKDKLDLTYSVKVPLEIEKPADESVLIPILVQGSTEQGESVDQVFLVDDSGKGITLSSGSYSLSFPASPLAEDGTLYSVPDEVVSVEIEEDLSEEDEEAAVAPRTSLRFAKMSALEQTDSMIEASYEYAIRGGMAESEAGRLRQIALDAHEQAVEAESLRIAEEEAAKEREISEGCRYDCTYFSLSLPSSWYGRWSVQVDETWHPARIADQPMTSVHTFSLDGEVVFTMTHRTSNLSTENAIGFTSFGGQVYFEGSPSMSDEDKAKVRGSVSLK